MGVAGSAPQRAKREHWLSRHGWNVLESQGTVAWSRAPRHSWPPFSRPPSESLHRAASAGPRGPRSLLTCLKGLCWKKPASSSPPAEWTPSWVRLKLCWSIAVGLPCSAARDHLSVGPLSCGLGQMWALMPFKTFVSSISFCNSSPNWLHRGRHKSVVANSLRRVLPSCPHPLLSPHDILKTSYSPILWMGSLGHREVR